MPKPAPPPAAAPAAASAAPAAASAAPAAASAAPAAASAAPAEPLATSSNGSWFSLSAISNQFGSKPKSQKVLDAEKNLAESKQKYEDEIKAAEAAVEAAVEAAKKLPGVGGKRKNRNRNKNSKKKNKTGGKKPRNGNRKTIRK